MSRLVAGAEATTSAQGIVSILAGNEGGINVTTGELSLKQATASQIGGIKQGAGLTITSGVAAVNLTDSTTSTSTTTAASGLAVRTLNLASMLLDGTQAMTGKLTTATPSTNAGLNLPSGTAGSPVTGDVWNQGGTLKMRTDGSTTKDIAFTTGSNISGNAATATALTPGATIAIAGAVTSAAQTFTGSSNLTFSTTLAAGQAVTSLTGVADRILVNGTTGTATTGAVTLSLPQNIATNSAVTFGSATLGNILISNVANKITTSSAGLTLEPASGATAVTGSLAVSTALTVQTTSGLTGAVTLGSSLALSTAASKIGFGNADATLATTSINRAPGILGSATTGDLVLRVPTDGKAYLVSNTTVATNPAANDALVTKGVMDTAISAATAAGLTTAGGIAASGSQTFGATSGSFIVSNGGAAKLTITNGGPATFTNALTVTNGGIVISNSGGLTVSGTTAITGALSATLNVTAATAPSTSSHLTNKEYVDGAINSISDTDANLVLKKLLMQIPIRQFTVAPLVDAKISVYTTEITNMVVNVPKYFTGFHRANGTRSLSIVVPENYQIIILHFSSTTTDFTNSFTALGRTTTNLHTLPVNPVSQMLAFRTGDTALSSSGTFTRTAVGTTFIGGPGGSTFSIFSDVGAVGHRSDLILMRIA